MPPVPCDDPPPRVVNVGRCRYRCRLLPLSAVVIGHHCCRRRPLPLSVVVAGRWRCRRRLLPSAVVVGYCRRLLLTLAYAAAVIYHCLCHRLLPSRTTESDGGGAREQVGCQRLLEYRKTHAATLPARFKTSSWNTDNHLRQAWRTTGAQQHPAYTRCKKKLNHSIGQSSHAR